jgi:hypothetical protein
LTKDGGQLIVFSPNIPGKKLQFQVKHTKFHCYIPLMQVNKTKHVHQLINCGEKIKVMIAQV